MEKEVGLKIACGFGGGIGRTGRTCGAVTGAVMVIGLKYGQVSLACEESRRKTHKLVREFIKRFTALHGSTECRELIGCDLSSPAGLRAARKSGVFRDRCSTFVYDAARILQDMLHVQ